MRVFLLSIPALLIASSAFGATPISVWPVDSLTKVFPDDPSGKNGASDQAWLLARNGHTTVQFAIRSITPRAALEATVKLGGGLQTQVRHAGYVPVRANPPDTPADEVVRSAPAKFPDPLFEDFPFRLDANQTTPLWIHSLCAQRNQAWHIQGRNHIPRR